MSYTKQSHGMSHSMLINIRIGSVNGGPGQPEQPCVAPWLTHPNARGLVVWVVREQAAVPVTYIQDLLAGRETAGCTRSHSHPVGCTMEGARTGNSTASHASAIKVEQLRRRQHS